MNFFEKAQARANAQEILGLNGHPNQDEIKGAFKKRAFESHPDRNNGCSEEFSRVTAAYALLKDDKGYTSADRLRPAPEDTGATTFHSKSHNKNCSASSSAENHKDLSSYVAPRRLHTAMTSRIYKINQTEASECRTLFDEIPFMAEPEPDEKSLRADILDIIKESGAPFVPHTNHLPYAVRQRGRRISYMVKAPIEKGVNRVAVPTGTFSDNRKVKPIMVRFKAAGKGQGTHVAAATTLAESFPGAKSVRIHFDLGEWPDLASEHADAA